MLPPVLLAGFLHAAARLAAAPLLLCFALGGRALEDTVSALPTILPPATFGAAREHVGWMVSRDTSALDETGVAKAAVESLLENGNDAVFGALFWFFLLGGPGALLFRLANTLDAMWATATNASSASAPPRNLDDVLNYFPANLTALTYALFGKTSRALACWRKQAPQWDSPNAGPVMAAGAGALQVSLGGAAIYHGQLEVRPTLGEGRAPQPLDIARALALDAPRDAPVAHFGAGARPRLRHSSCPERRMLEHGGRLRVAAAQWAPLADWLDLSTGINPQGWPVSPLPADCWRRLPEDNDGLEEAAAAYYGNVNLLPLAGSQAAIQCLPTLLLPRAAVVAYRRRFTPNTRMPGTRRPQVRRLAGANLARALTAMAPNVLLCNPNNPTGRAYPRDELRSTPRRN